MKEEVKTLDRITIGYLIDMILMRAKYSIQYYDYEKNQWTTPIFLRPERIAHFIDKSIYRIKFIY